MSISEDYFKLVTAIGSQKLSISMTTTLLPNNGKCDYKYPFFFSMFFFFQLGMFFLLYKIYDVMQSGLARKPTYHLICE